MRKLVLAIIFSTAVPSLGIADDAPNCAPGWVTKTCSNYTGCAMPEWECCPFQTGDGWQWSDPPCPQSEQ